jgi:nifR3 family TIM-barrel protein
MRIGPHSIGDGAALAPMAGITNPPFRQLCRELGAVLTSTELISCHAVVYLYTKPRNRIRKQGIKTLSLLSPYPGETPFAVQIYGREPELMASAAGLVVREGADIVDLNFGCPARKVVKRGEGSGVALMRDPVLLGRIARAVVAEVDVPVTAKIRTGWSYEERNAPEVAKILEEEGVAAICVHARSREQVHSGPVDLETLAAVREIVQIPLIGNGGIREPEQARQMISATGCDRVAIGQSARGNPWIFRRMTGGAGAPDLAGRVSTCRRHLALYAAFTDEERAAREMRKHACWYLRGFDGAAAFRKRLSEAIDAESFSRLLDELSPR